MSTLSRDILIENILTLKNSKVKNMVGRRIREFLRLKKGSNEELFKELCFCILTANYSAEKGIFIQKEIGDGFLYLDQFTLERKLKVLGHRFPRKRAEYIVLARRYLDFLKESIYSFDNSKLAREWLVNNIKGIGYKEGFGKCGHLPSLP